MLGVNLLNKFNEISQKLANENDRNEDSYCIN